MKRQHWTVSVLIGALISLILTVIGTALLALFAKDVQTENTVVSIIAVAVKLISIALGVWFACRKIRKKGLLVGIGVGAVYWVLTTAFSYAVGNGFAFSLNTLFDVMLTLAIGLFSGILFVNTLK